MNDHASKRRLAWVGTMAAFTGFAITFTAAAVAGDWPQILGPTRNGIAANETLAASWGTQGPQLLWQQPAGSGLAGVAVADGKAILFHREQNDEIATAFDAATGKPLWKAAFPTRYVSTISPDDGPRCVPTVHGGMVYLFGAGGHLHCVTLDAGKAVWSRNCATEFKAPEGYFGWGSSPIVVADRLLVNVGGADAEAGIVAFDLKTGQTLWKATAEQASYSSPIVAKVGQKEQAVFITRYNAVGLDPATGAVLWKIPFGKRGPTVNAANPLVLGDHVFLTASYGIGAVYAELAGPEPKVAWASDDVLSSQYTTPIYKDGYLYGIDGREDIGVASLRCIDPTTGKVAWTQQDLGKGSLILAGDKLLVQTTDGQLRLVAASPKEYEELANAKVCGGQAYALPALAEGRYYVRDGDTLHCYNLKEK